MKSFICLLLFSKIFSKFIEVRALYDEENKMIIYNNNTYTPVPLSLIVAENPTYEDITLDLLMVGFLTLFAGAMSGLTVGYLSIDDLVLELKSNTGTEIEKIYSKKVLPIISKRHWLLVTYLVIRKGTEKELEKQRGRREKGKNRHCV